MPQNFNSLKDLGKFFNKDKEPEEEPVEKKENNTQRHPDSGRRSDRGGRRPFIETDSGTEGQNTENETPEPSFERTRGSLDIKDDIINRYKSSRRDGLGNVRRNSLSAQARGLIQMFFPDKISEFRDAVQKNPEAVLSILESLPSMPVKVRSSLNEKLEVFTDVEIEGIKYSFKRWGPNRYLLNGDKEELITTERDMGDNYIKTATIEGKKLEGRDLLAVRIACEYEEVL